jgi:hypothetical protein
MKRNEICPHCMSYMSCHPTLLKYRKCNSCGFCNREKRSLMLTVDDIMTSSGKYPDRAKSPECTQEVKDNAVRLIVAINSLLEDMGITEVVVSSGFRTLAANMALTNSAKHSLHMAGMAVDIEDKDGSLKTLIESKPDLLHTYQVWMENPNSCPGWCHLDIGIRADRALRIFIP